MCGIVGYIGDKQASSILLDGLKRLEYRGYDSAGVVVWEAGNCQIRRSLGRIADLERRSEPYQLRGKLGIGHTRWATHGRPSDDNAHPHTDCQGIFAVVHNGIIENYAHLKDELEAKGHHFTSETDTEVIPHLLEELYQGDAEEAFRQALARLEGAFALGVICRDEPEKLLAARKDSPLVVGLGQDENYIASDIPAILHYTRDTYILENGEMAVLEPGGVRLSDFAGRPVQKDVFHVTWDPEQAEKAGFEHYMLKEIFEQPQALRDTMWTRVRGDELNLDELRLTRERAQELENIYIVACGTAYHAGLAGKQLLESMAQIPVDVDIASEFRYRNPIFRPNTLVIIISQSGETADTLAALRESHRHGSRVVAITNVVGSSVAREADDVLYTWAGPEIAVASTKAYLTQLAAMAMLAAHLGKLRDTASRQQVADLLQYLQAMPRHVDNLLQRAGEVEVIAQDIAASGDHTFFIGRLLDYAVAMEGALKLKEISYIHAEAYGAGELKHGTLALVTRGVPVVALATQPAVYEKMLSNIQEVLAREAEVVALACQSHSHGLDNLARHVFLLPDTHPNLAPMLAVVPLQLLAYYAAVARGTNVDKPRNLAKSVTVE